MHFTTMPMVIFFHSSSFVHCQLFQLADVVSQSSIIVSASVAQLKVLPKSIFRYFLCPLQVCFPLVISLQNNFFSKCLLSNCGRQSPYLSVIRNGTTHSLFSFWLAWHKSEVIVLLNKSATNLTADVSIISLSMIFFYTPTGVYQRGIYQKDFLPKGQEEQNNVEYARSDRFTDTKFSSCYTTT